LTRLTAADLAAEKNDIAVICAPSRPGIFLCPGEPDECCGFDGTFSIFEEPVSAKMGFDKVVDHRDADPASRSARLLAHDNSAHGLDRARTPVAHWSAG
jgi:hypothetical protein